MIPSEDSFFRLFLRDTSLVSKSLNSLILLVLLRSDLLDLLYDPINLVISFKESVGVSVKTFINST